MQGKVAKHVPRNQTPYLRVATITEKKAELTFFYVGTDEEAKELLFSTFQNGFVAAGYDEARKLIRSDKFSNQLDVIIMDVPYQSKELRDFQAFLKSRGLHFTTPFIYNEQWIMGNESALLQESLVDDIVDLGNWQYDFSTKITFLKKTKEYSIVSNAATEEIRVTNQFFKRLFDVLVASILLVITLPLFILIAICIKLESKGPIFYNAKRAGRGFKVFKFYKFRTMEINADKKIEKLAHLNQYEGSGQARFFKLTNDPRVTRVGKFLRNSSFDELPQLFNVLKGDMSLVGNRPLPIYEAATLTTNEFVERFMAPAGMTGLWQIKKRGKSDMSTEERISLDISYARKSSLWYDLWIMANTPGALMQKADV